MPEFGIMRDAQTAKPQAFRTGDAVRALAWLGPKEVEENLGAIEKRLSSRDLEEMAAARAVMPAWLAEHVSTMVSDS